MKPIFTKYQVVAAKKAYWRRNSFSQEYALIIKCYPGILYRIKNRHPYKFAVVGKPYQGWNYAKYKDLPNGKHNIESIEQEVISFSKEAFFHKMLKQAKAKGLVKYKNDIS